MSSSWRSLFFNRYIQLTWRSGQPLVYPADQNGTGCDEEDFQSAVNHARTEKDSGGSRNDSPETHHIWMIDPGISLAAAVQDDENAEHERSRTRKGKPHVKRREKRENFRFIRG